ncbi:S41 family peptidase [Flavobacterium sp. HJJ]|uniref:S41 family peptidase n=1 Tax=Flavobacterium sp. HJJ TaxID=2783792 RepID=UPI00188B470B|nr:S41 family peptidase [Flavobacterium sp. HJJ]MBF4472453.1 peptidase S41 [Flavobacterium sp. HJJ]
MKKTTLLFLLLLTQITFGYNKITKTQKLATTCKVWGFLKYYHPNVADGSKNWDEQLFTILPEVEKAQTKEEFSLVLEKWIASQGEVKAYEATKPDSKVEYFIKNLDLKWLDDSKVFSKTLSKKLKFIEENRFQGKQHNVQYGAHDASLLEFINEVKYPNFKWSDENLRLLTLFRYWNYVEYFFPYKYQMDQKWDIILNEMLPRFIASESEIDFHLAIKELSAKLNDTHTSFGTNKMFDRFGDKWMPINIKIIDEKVIVTGFQNDSLAKIDDYKIGDVITKIDGKTISQLIKENKKYGEGSNKSAVLDKLYWLFVMGKSNVGEIEFNRDGTKSIKTIKRYPYQDLKIQFKEKEKWNVLTDNIGYVNMGDLTEADVPLMMEQLKNTKAIIFDIRNYPQGTNYAIAEYLNPEPKEFVKFIEPDLSFAGRYIWRNGIETCGKINPDYYKGKVVLLVNEKSISHSEYTAMTLQVAPNATIIGSQTAGADGANTRFEIIKGLQTSFTCYGVFYPNKKETQRIGIVPNIEVKQTIKGIQEGRDEILDEAIRFINK